MSGSAQKKDPLGIQPAPAYGDQRPNYSDERRRTRVEAVVPFFKTNYIEHKPQTDFVDQLLAHLSAMRPLLGGPIDGRGLSEFSNAGKSRTIEHLVRTAAARRVKAGLPPNPYQILVIELDKTTTVAAIWVGAAHVASRGATCAGRQCPPHPSRHSTPSLRSGIVLRPT